MVRALQWSRGQDSAIQVLLNRKKKTKQKNKTTLKLLTAALKPSCPFFRGSKGWSRPERQRDGLAIMLRQQSWSSEAQPTPLWRLSCAFRAGHSCLSPLLLSERRESESIYSRGYETRNDETKCIEMQGGAGGRPIQGIKQHLFLACRQRVGLWRELGNRN